MLSSPNHVFDSPSVLPLPIHPICTSKALVTNNHGNPTFAKWRASEMRTHYLFQLRIYEKNHIFSSIAVKIKSPGNLHFSNQK